MRMISRKNIIFISIPIFLCLHEAAFAASGAGQSVKEANRLYRKGKLDEALQKYNEASAAMPDSDIINFDMGAASYKKGDYQKAQDSFTKALISDNKKIEADALYNLGNCKYKLGKLKENTDLSATVSLLRESLDYYKRAVELDQKNADARFNHEFVERELKVLLDKLKKQQESNKDKQKDKQGQQQEEKQSQEKEQKQGQQQEEKQARQKEEKKEGAGEANKEEGKEEKDKAQAVKEQDQQDKEKAAKEEKEQEGEKKELSEEGARALLERYGRDEAKPDYMDKDQQRGYDSQVSKDW